MEAVDSELAYVEGVVERRNGVESRGGPNIVQPLSASYV